MINYSEHILYKTEELLNLSTNRYKVVIQIAQRAKRRNSSEDFKIKPVIRAILEMVDEITQPEIITD